MQIIDLNRITVGARQRTRMDPTALIELETSILKNGLIHPPTCRVHVNEEGDLAYQLVAGERRTKAIKRIAEKGISFVCDQQTIAPGKIPILTLHEAVGHATLKQIEFDENKIREQLPWQDEAQALAEIHRLRLEEDITATRKETAEELIANKVVDTTSVPALAQKIGQATIITEHLHDPHIAAARNATEAFNLIIKKEDEALRAALAKRQLAGRTSDTPPISIRHGSCFDLLPVLDGQLADLILADPPFGIGAHTGGFRQRTIHHHNYEDTPEFARRIAQAILLDGFRIAKQQANLFMFCDIDLFHVLKEMAGRVGWVPFRTPLIWQKSHSEGMAPWQSKGPRRTYELIFYATKGQRGLISSPIDILDHKRVPKTERLHGAQKPLDLLLRLIECCTLPGDFVLDPCCGSGSTLVAARDSNRRGLGIEVDESHYNTAMSNVFSAAPGKQDARADSLASLA